MGPDQHQGLEPVILIVLFLSMPHFMNPINQLNHQLLWSKTMLPHPEIAMKHSILRMLPMLMRLLANWYRGSRN